MIIDTNLLYWRDNTTNAGGGPAETPIFNGFLEMLETRKK